MRVIERIVSMVGRRIDESSPMWTRASPTARASTPSSRRSPRTAHRLHPPLRRETLRMTALIGEGALTKEIAEMFEMCVQARLDSSSPAAPAPARPRSETRCPAYIPETQRISPSKTRRVADPAAARRPPRNAPANIEGRGEVTQRDLVRNALRMRPDRIVVGEGARRRGLRHCFRQNTGHEGSLTTIHANTPRDALARLETMIQMTGMRLSEKAMRQQVASALDLVIQATRLSDGTRRVTSISEITGMEGDIITMQEIFQFERNGIDKDGPRHRPLPPHGRPPALRRAPQALRAALPASFSRNSGER